MGDVGLLQPHAHLRHKVSHVRQIVAAFKHQTPHRELCQLVHPHIPVLLAARVAWHRGCGGPFNWKGGLQVVALQT